MCCVHELRICVTLITSKENTNNTVGNFLKETRYYFRISKHTL